MPLYEYECESCGRRFERIQKFSDPLVVACPTCDGPVRKLFSSPAIQFKGSGFYITDYAKAGSKAPDGAGTGESKSTADSSAPAESSKSEPSKPEAPKAQTSTSASGSSESSAPSPKPEPSKAPAGSGSKN